MLSEFEYFRPYEIEYPKQVLSVLHVDVRGLQRLVPKAEFLQGLYVLPKKCFNTFGESFCWFPCDTYADAPDVGVLPEYILQADQSIKNILVNTFPYSVEVYPRNESSVVFESTKYHGGYADKRSRMIVDSNGRILSTSQFERKIRAKNGKIIPYSNESNTSRKLHHTHQRAFWMLSDYRSGISKKIISDSDDGGITHIPVESTVRHVLEMREFEVINRIREVRCHFER